MKVYSKSLAIILVLIGFSAHAQEDTLNLEASVLTVEKKTSMISVSRLSTVSFNTEAMNQFPKIFGSVDPVRFAQSLPGIQTNNIFDSGISIQGCNSSQNEYTICGAPYYPAPRLLGLMPTTNTDIFTEMKLKTNSQGNFIGGALVMDIPDSLATMVHATGSVGLISAQGSVNVPLSHNWNVFAGARKSYINLIYGSLLSKGLGDVSYDFADANLGAKWKPNQFNSVDISLFWGSDTPNISFSTFSGNYKITQALASARWKHKGAIPQTHTVFVSNLDKFFNLGLEFADCSIKSYRTEVGWKGELGLPFEIKARPSFSYNQVLPQAPLVEGEFTDIKSTKKEPQKSIIGSIDVDRPFEINDFKIVPQVTLNYYRELNDTQGFFNVDPSVHFEYNMYQNGTLSLNLGRKHQYFTELTVMPSFVPVQFWIANNSTHKPQEAWFADLSHTINLDSEKWSITSKIYYKKMLNQLEFSGFFVTMGLSQYNLDDYLIPTYGDNFGANIMLSKNTGNLTGWISYSFGKAIRQTDKADFPKSFPASTERPHEFNAVVSWKIGSLEIGGTLVFASGTPFTPIKRIYFISDSILSEFDDFNSGRLAPYFRVDFSATWNFKRIKRMDHGINVSVYNATASKNEVGYCINLNYEDGTYYYGPYKMPLRVLPSISYFIKL